MMRAMVVLEDFGMRIIAFVAALWAGPSAALADGGFVVDMEPDEIRRLDGRRYVSDLSVGEAAEVNHLQVCLHNGALLMQPYASLTTDENYQIKRRVTRVTDTEVLIEITPTDRASAKSIRYEATRFAHLKCNELSNEYYGVPTYRVLSINGATSFTELLKTPPFAGVVTN